MTSRMLRRKLHQNLYRLHQKHYRILYIKNIFDVRIVNTTLNFKIAIYIVSLTIN